MVQGRMASPIRLVLVEDNDTFRQALELLFGLRSDVEVIGSVADGLEAADACRELQPDVLLMDYRLRDLDGLRVAHAVKEVCPTVAIVCLSASVTGTEWKGLEEAGVTAYVSKDQDLETIIGVIRSAAKSVPA
jgi:two-component system secretion response regulator SsrB